MPTAISSIHNAHIKAVLKLDKRAERTARGVTLVEGAREVRQAVDAGIIPLEAYICPDLTADRELAPVLAALAAWEQQRLTAVFHVAADVFARIAVREESGGVLLVIPTPAAGLEQLTLRSPAFLLVVEGAEKPGNLGAILRSADAAGVHGVIVCGGTDLYNPNVVRASLGAVFAVPTVQADSSLAAAWLAAHQVRIVAATPAGAVDYTQVDYREGVAIVVGSEAEGLSDAWLLAADARVAIPMFGRVDSLNLSASAAVLLYEVVRQRRGR